MSILCLSEVKAGALSARTGEKLGLSSAREAGESPIFVHFRAASYADAYLTHFSVAQILI
jgi:hypothetical protein